MAKKPKAKLKVVDSSFKCLPEEREYFRALHKMLDEIYLEASNVYEWTWADLAKQADCSYLTVVKLGERQTRYPRFHTVFKLARAVDWHIMINQNQKITKKLNKKAS